MLFVNLNRTGQRLLRCAGRTLVICTCFIFASCQQNSANQVRQRRAGQSGQTIKVKKGESLQRAIETAKSGDTILLEPGETYEPVLLPFEPAGPNSDYINIETENFSAIVKENERVKPQEHAKQMAKILAPGGKPAVSTVPMAHHYRFVGIEFAPLPSADYIYNLIDLGASDYTSESQFPHHLVFDRCYVHSTGLNKARRGFAINSKETSIVNSHISGFAGAGDETQAISGWNGPGPFHIVNNFLEAGAEMILIGGADPSIPNLVPSDIEIRRNHLYRPKEWEGRATIKGSFELKNSRRVVVDGNVIESKILTTAFVITVRNQNGKAPWSTIEDVEIKNNVVLGASSGFNILGSDNEHPSQTARSITISNNLVLGVVQSSPDNNAFFLQINGGVSITVAHNTVQHSGNIITSYGKPTENFIFKDNILQHNHYGLVCTISGPPCKGPFCQCFPGALIKGNVIADNVGAISNEPSIKTGYPPGNFFTASYEELGFVNHGRGNWTLSPGSKFRGKATDAKDPGINIDLLRAAGINNPDSISN